MRSEPAIFIQNPDEYKCEPFKIMGNLYYVGNQTVSSHLIQTEDGLVLIDTTYEETAYHVLESVGKLGFDIKDINHILLCHAHYDHCGGTKKIVEKTNAKTYMGEDDIDIAANRPELSWSNEYGVVYHDMFVADVPLKDNDILTFGTTKITCIHAPGHTPGNMAYFFDIKDDGGNNIRVGINGGPGRNTLQDDYMKMYNIKQERKQQYINSMEKLLKIKVDLMINPHPNPDANYLGASSDYDSSTQKPFAQVVTWKEWMNNLVEKGKQEFDL